MKKLLIVEDDTDLRTILKNKFEQEGFTVFVGWDGEEGLRLALKEHPDLILLDIIMPKMDGITVMKKLNEDSWGKNAKIIFLTNLSDSEKVTEALQQKQYDYLVKSEWALESLVKKVHTKLGT